MKYVYGVLGIVLTLGGVLASMDSGEGSMVVPIIMVVLGAVFLGLRLHAARFGATTTDPPRGE